MKKSLKKTQTFVHAVLRRAHTNRSKHGNCAPLLILLAMLLVLSACGNVAQNGNPSFEYSAGVGTNTRSTLANDLSKGLDLSSSTATTQSSEKDNGPVRQNTNTANSVQSDVPNFFNSNADGVSTEDTYISKSDAIATVITSNGSQSSQSSENDPPADVPPANSTFEVHFINVGQADSALVLCDGEAMLIDGGNAEDSNLIYAYLKKLSCDHLEYIICTHGHEDHVGGLSGALNFSTVDHALCSVTSYDSKAFKNFVKYLDKQGLSVEVPRAGDSFSLGSASVSVLGPISSSDEPNNTSIVLKVQYGATSFLFTGDTEREEEQEISNAGYDLSSTVLKVGHHGGANSTTYPFLREIMPAYAVISVGEGNSYGHPTEEALSRLRDADVKVYRTDMQGDIICTSDGNTVSFSVERNADADTLAAVGKNSTQSKDTSSSSSTETASKLKEDSKPKEETKPSNPTPASKPKEEEKETVTPIPAGADYILNKNTHKFHYPSCGSVKQMSEKNKLAFNGTRDEVIAMGYEPCKKCNP